MGKTKSAKRKKSAQTDPVMDQLSVIDAKSLLVGNLISMGWRLAITVLLPIFIGVQLDKRFSSTPSLTLAAFFIAVFASGLLIYKTYTELNSQTELKPKRRRRFKKEPNV